MQILSRVIALIPFILCIAGTVLSALCLFAGHKEGFMEDFAIARVNTSGLGHNLLDTGNDSSNNDDDGGIIGDIKGAWDDAKDKIKDKLNDITGDIADDLASTIGIQEWYSIHVMDACEGNYKPNATAPNPGYNVTNCTDSSPNNRFNLTDMLNHELEIGPFSLNLADLNWPDGIQDKLDILNDVLLGLFIVYVLGVGFGGIGVIGSLVNVLAPRRSLVVINFIITLLGAVVTTVASIIVTVALTKGIDEINKIGDDVGVSANKGNKFLALTWAAAGSMLIAALIWTFEFCVVAKERRRRLPPAKKMEAY